MLRKAVYLYLSNFILLDIIIGFLINYFSVDGALHPGLLIRGVLLILLILKLLSDLKKGLIRGGNTLFYLLVFLIISICINTLLRLSPIFLIHEFVNASKPIFILLLSYYVYINKHYFKSKTEVIFKSNYWVFILNILLSFITGIGISTYDNVTGSTKGFLDAGNSASILGLVFLIYFLFNDDISFKGKLFYLSVSSYVIYVIGTKVIFLIPAILLIFVVLQIYRSKRYRFLKFALVMAPLLLTSYIIISELVNTLLPRYLPMLKNMNLANVGEFTFYDFLTTYRRTNYAIEQTIYQFSDFESMLFGVGDTGQNEFWKDYSFKFAGMDFFDFLFQYGLICVGFLIYYTRKAVRFNFRNKNETSIKVCLIIILLYSFFGGYVLYSLTSGTMLAFLLGLNLNSK